jgi:hypothetical protein
LSYFVFDRCHFSLGYQERRVFVATLGIVLAVVFLYYLVEVLLGSSRSVYNSEFGVPSSFEEKKRLSHAEFFGRAVPLGLTAAGFPLLGTCPVSGFLMLLTAFLLFFVIFK